MTTDHTRSARQGGALRVLLTVIALMMLLWTPVSLSAQYCPPPYSSGCSAGCDMYLSNQECTQTRCTEFGEMTCDPWTFIVLDGNELCFDACGYVIDYICQCFQ